MHQEKGTFLLPNLFLATSRNILMEWLLSKNVTLLSDNKLSFTANVNGSNFFPDANEDLPPKCPKPSGDMIQITGFVNADHTQNCVTY